MTSILVMSDSHGNKELVNLLIDYAKKVKPDFIYHLGDYYDDANPIIEEGFACVRVPGTWTPYYQDFRIENRKFEIVDGWRFYLTHTPTTHYNDLADDTDPEDIINQRQADIVLHGHTHNYDISENNNVLVINPGQTKAKSDKGRPATFAQIYVDDKQISVEILDLYTNLIYKSHIKLKNN